MPENVEWLTRKVSQYSIVPQRVVLSVFGFLAIVNAYTMRLCLDIALTHVVMQKVPQSATPVPSNINKQQKNIIDPKATPKLSRLRSRLRSLQDRDAPKKAAAAIEPPPNKYDWSGQLQTFILISFYIGYVASQVPGAQLAERYGGKWVLAVGIALTAVLTILTPLAIKQGGPVTLVLVRILVGLCEGPTFPALSALLARWVPAKERGTLGVLVLSGSQVGILMANFLSGLLLQHGDWPLLFYFFGGCGLLWFVCFTGLCYSEPSANPFIRETEKQYLHEEIGDVCSEPEQRATPWRQIFLSLPVWALISATVQYDWSQQQGTANVQEIINNMNQLPLGESFVAGVSSSLPYILNWLVSLLSGVISDLLINYNICTVTMTRRIMALIAVVAPDLFASLTPCFTCPEMNDSLSVFNCVCGVVGTYYAGIKLTPLDMSPNFAGTIMAIANGFGSLTGLVVPYFKDAANEFTHFRELRALLWLACTMLISGEIQPFNRPITTLKIE